MKRFFSDDPILLLFELHTVKTMEIGVSRRRFETCSIQTMFVSDGLFCVTNIDETHCHAFKLKLIFLLPPPPPTSRSSFLASHTLFARPAGSAGLV